MKAQKIDHTFLTNTWSETPVKITGEEARRIDTCIDQFGTDEEKYAVEGIDGIEAIDALVEEFGIERISDVWFSQWNLI